MGVSGWVSGGRPGWTRARAGAGRGPWPWLWKEKGGGPAPLRPSRRPLPPQPARRPPTPAAERGGKQSNGDPRRRGPGRRPCPEPACPGPPSKAGSGARRPPLQVTNRGEAGTTAGLGGSEGRTRPELPLRLFETAGTAGTAGPAPRTLGWRWDGGLWRRGAALGCRSPSRVSCRLGKIPDKAPSSLPSQGLGLQLQTDPGWNP